MSFQKSFDEIYDSILTDYRNQNGVVDAETLLRSACLSSALWGLYYEIEQAAKQIFPDTADHNNLLHHGSNRGLAPVSGETDAEFLARLQADERRPPVGGNQYDYEKWAKTINNVAKAFSFPLAQGDGTVDLVIIADESATGYELPSNSCRIGNTTFAEAFKLHDTAAAFSTALAVAVGDVVENAAKRRSATVVAVDSAIKLTLSDDIFKYSNEPYILYSHVGTSTSLTAGKLVDSAAAFNNAGRPAVKGDVVENLDNNTETVVTVVDGATTLSLRDDIFTAIGKRYIVRSVIAQVKKYIETVRPVGASRVTCLTPTIQTEAVTMAVTGQSVDKAKIALDIESYQSSLEPGQVMYKARLISIAIQNGAENVTLSAPAADVTPDAYEMIRPGTITVT